MDAVLLSRWHRGRIALRRCCIESQVGSELRYVTEPMAEYGKTKDRGRARRTYWEPLTVIAILAGAIVVVVPAIIGRSELPTLDANTKKMVIAKERETPFTPGVPGRSSSEACNTTSRACQQWTALAVGCEENMKRRDAGYLGKFSRSYCEEMEQFREQVTGIAASTEQGAYQF